MLQMVMDLVHSCSVILIQENVLSKINPIKM